MKGLNHGLFIAVILLSILVIILIRMITIYRKRIQEAVQLMSKYKESVNKDYEKDVQYLNHMIDEKLKYINTSIFPYISKGGKVITDEDMNKLISSVAIDVKRNLSSNYKELIGFYIADLDLFIGSRLKSTLEPQFLSHNIRTLKQGTSMGDIIEEYTESIKNQKEQ